MNEDLRETVARAIYYSNDVNAYGDVPIWEELEDLSPREREVAFEQGDAASAAATPITEALLRETIEDLVRQFAYPITRDGVPCLSDGGLSALEGAFAVLGWESPYPCPENACEAPGCSEWATCGTPTPDGYKRLCGAHFMALQHAATGDGDAGENTHEQQ